MPAVLLDTNAISDLMRDHPQVKARLGQCVDPIATSVVVVGEIHYGLSRLPAGKKRTDLEARAHAILAAVRVDPVSESVAVSYGRLKASLEGRGLNLDDNDLWIAATAIAQGGRFVTRDQIFSQVPGLQVEDWSA
ncbi:MAG TPA: type II toxin-antitoxin system VapC family toxin [Fimbriiglobus sp.]|nr:type II toxin-antitoxin system VapC family toxin [Fimbriiglobus sp.]